MQCADPLGPFGSSSSLTEHRSTALEISIAIFPMKTSTTDSGPEREASSPYSVAPDLKGKSRRGKADDAAARSITEARAKSLLKVATLQIQEELGQRPLFPDPHQQFTAALGRLFRPDELVTVIKHFQVDDSKKVRPDGKGITRSAAEWIQSGNETCTVPQCDAGAWMMVNPSNGQGIEDRHVTDYRFLLLESDGLPLELQIAMLRHLPLPIICMTMSGRRSIHAIVEVGAHDAGAYKDIADAILTPLKEFGFDSSCRNPSRLTRAPGAVRKLDVKAPTVQELIYLRPPAVGPATPIVEPIKALHELLKKVFEFRTTPQNPKHQFYYDGGTRLYWRQDNNGVYLAVDEKSVIRALAVEMGLSRKSEGRGSEVEHMVNRLQTHFNVAYAGPLAGYPAGLHREGNRRLLITEGPTLIQPTEGEWPLVTQLLGRMFQCGAIDQRPYFYGWLKCAVECLQSGLRRPGQAIVLAGPPGSGKSLIQSLITQVLGGRSERPFTYLVGESSFNAEVFSCVHQLIEDEISTRDMRSRRRIGTAIKGMVANETQRCRRMRTDAIALKPMWRISISLNDEPEDLLVLPPLDMGIRDKFILFAITDGPPPMPINSIGDRDAMWKALVAELPAFLWFLQQWEIPQDLRHPRYGVREFHHPQLLAALRQTAPEERLLEIIDITVFNGMDSSIAEPWQGGALELEQELLRSDFQREVTALFSFNGASGTFLRRLSNDHPDRISSTVVRGRTRWAIRPPAALAIEVNELPLTERPMPVLPQPPDDSTGLDLTE